MSIYMTGVGVGSFKVTYNAVDLTDHIRSVTINQTFDDIDVTAMGAVAHAHVPGLRDDSVDIEFYQDFAASEVDATINGLLGSTSGATLLIQTSGTTVTATAPKYTVLAAPFNYSPIDGQVGTASMTKVTFKPVAGQYIARGTS